MYTKNDFVFYLYLKFWQVLNKIYFTEYVIKFPLRLDLFSDEKIDVKKHLLWKKPNIVIFSSRRPYATKYDPFKDLHCTKNFSSFQHSKDMYWNVLTDSAITSINS